MVAPPKGGDAAPLGPGLALFEDPPERDRGTLPSGLRELLALDADCSAEDYWVHPRIGPPQWDLAAILEDLAITKRSLNLPPPSSAALEDGHPLPS